MSLEGEHTRKSLSRRLQWLETGLYWRRKWPGLRLHRLYSWHFGTLAVWLPSSDSKNTGSCTIGAKMSTNIHVCQTWYAVLFHLLILDSSLFFIFISLKKTFQGVQPGQCQCKEGYAGEKCDHCAFGYKGYPDCVHCNCSLVGSINDDPCTEPCICKVSIELLFWNFKWDL